MKTIKKFHKLYVFTSLLTALALLTGSIPMNVLAYQNDIQPTGSPSQSQSAENLSATESSKSDSAVNKNPDIEVRDSNAPSGDNAQNIESGDEASDREASDNDSLNNRVSDSETSDDGTSDNKTSDNGTSNNEASDDQTSDDIASGDDTPSDDGSEDNETDADDISGEETDEAADDIIDSQISTEEDKTSCETSDEAITIPDVSGDFSESLERFREIAAQKTLMALLYHTERYELECSDNSTCSIESGHTLYVDDISYNDAELMYHVSFWYDGTLKDGWLPEYLLAYADEDWLSWKQDFLSKIPSVFSFGLSAFSDTSEIEAFPSAYRKALSELKKSYPNWVFVPMNTGIDFNTAVNNEKGEKCLIQNTSSNASKGWVGSPCPSEGGWNYANDTAISHYMNPCNFLSENYIFQFEQLTFNSSYHNVASIANFLSGTFMKGMIPDDSSQRTYADAFFEIGKNRKLSPIHLASRVYQEQGKGTSGLISGTYPGFEGYYNYFNIKASGSTDKEKITNGLTYAKSKGWNTRYKSLEGGAAAIGNNYILKNQDTAYLQKFNVDKNSPYGLYNHQYMQNIQAPASESLNTYKMYKNAGSLSSSFVFKIPVYQNMPGSENDSSEGDDKNENNTEGSDEENSSENTDENNTDENNTDEDGADEDDAAKPESSEIFIEPIPDQSYTGAAVKPGLNIYNNIIYSDGSENMVELIEGTDYTLSYRNNKNVSTNDRTKPTVVVKYKGNFSGSSNVSFNILPLSIEDGNGSCTSVTLAYNKKMQKGKPVVCYGGKKLKPGVDYTLDYPDSDNPEAYIQPGIYSICVTGKGNYEGTLYTDEIISSKTLLSRVAIKKIPNQLYDRDVVDKENGIGIMPDSITVTYKNKELVQSMDDGLTGDYTVSYSDNLSIGTATLTITATESSDFAGSKSISYKIVGAPINRARITGIENKVFTGDESDVLQDSLCVESPTEGILEESFDNGISGDYIVSYSNINKCGTATITIKGINAYSGQIKRSYKITGSILSGDGMTLNPGFSMSYYTQEDPEAITDIQYLSQINAPYVKNRTTPYIILYYNGEPLTLNKDYTVKYSNNNRLTTSDMAQSKCPRIIISGKGNFKGSISGYFKITDGMLSNTDSKISIIAKDVVAREKPDSYKTTLTVTDINGARLSAGTDYEKEIVYTYVDDTTVKSAQSGSVLRKAGELINKSDIIPAGTALRASITGKGAYSGDGNTEISSVYKIISLDISKASVKVKQKDYENGAPVTISKSDIEKITLNGVNLKYGRDYIIDENSYANNTKKGTASVTLVGIGNVYGGQKKVTFKIKSQPVSFWTSLMSLMQQ